jgi:serine/threonine protein kinase/tetratricopeptide (TPR) repeat protein
VRESLRPLADSVADGTAVDWDEAAVQAAPEDRAFVRQLSILAKLTQIHGTLSEVPGPAVTAAGTRHHLNTPAIGAWAHLTLLERLGGGAFGEVYRAWDRQLEREVALKLLRGVEGVEDDPETSRITREGRLLARVRHPNVITVHGVDVHEGRVGLWMELLRGQTLEQILTTRGAFGPREAALVGIDLCRALAALHTAGLLHRDVKAENIIREDGGRIVLMDLGTGREIDTSGRRGLPDFAGTPLYIAPELFDGAPASEATDVYSLGILLYHLVTGSFPVLAKTVDELKHKHRTAPSMRIRDARADLPTVFVAVIDRAVAKNPAERYLTAGALEADLLRSIDDETLPLTVPATSANERAARSRLAPARRAAAVAGITAAIVVAGSLIAWPFLRNRDASTVAAFPPVRSIAVLPLVNLSGNADQDYFADGMTDELIGTLGRLDGINVISRTSSMQFKAAGKTLPEIARTLNVDAVLEGSVLMSAPSAGADNRVRINARLIRAGTDTQLWDRTFEAASADVIKLQRQIALAVADGIHARLLPERREAAGAGNAAPRQTGGGLEGFDLYLKGRYFWNMRTPDALKQSVQYFQESVTRGYVPAYAGLADAYNLLGYYGVMPADDARRLARAAATEGLERDPSLAEAHASRGFIEHDEYDWRGAAADFREAVGLKPGYSTGHHWYSNLLMQQGKFDEALREINTAVALDPLSVGVNGQLGALLVFMRRYDDAIVHLQRTIAIDPGFVRNRAVLAEAYAHTGQYEKALAELQAVPATGREETFVMGEIGYVYAASGRRSEGLQIISTLVARHASRETGAAGAAAVVYAGLGDAERAVYWLNEARSLLDPMIADLKVDPRFDKVRGDVRFTKLVETVGLAQ